MPDILCPTCGRPNPDDRNFCDFCGSPIKDLDPLSPDQSSLRDDFLEPEGGKNQESQDESARLDSFFADQDTPRDISDFQEPVQTGPDDDPFDLDDLLSPESQEQGPDPGERPLPGEDPEVSFQLDDFLGPAESGPEPTPEAGSSQFESQEDAFEFDDWFTPEESEGPASAEEPVQREGLGLEGRADQAEPGDPWLDKISQDLEPPGEISRSGDPFSLNQFEVEPDLSEDLPLPDQPSESLPSQFTEPDGGIATGDLWEEPEPSFESDTFEEDSGWLDMLQDPDSLEESQADSSPERKEKKPQTDWLERIKRLNKSAEFVEEDSSFPDWLSVSEKPAEEEQPAAPVEEPEAAPSSDLPAWLQLDENDEMLKEFLNKKDLTNEEYKPLIKKSTAELEESLPESYGAPEPAEDPSQPKKFPSWADSGSAPEEVPADLKFLTGMDQAAAPRKIVDPFQGEDDYLDDLFSEELPEWLTSATTGKEVLPFEEEISQGELPGWVEAMRPVVESSDASGLSDDEDYIENYGPLAGIPSVLPAEADIVQDPQKEAKKPLDLVATKTHQENVNLLKKLIGDETKTKSIQKAAPIQTQRVLRWLIAIILLVTTAGTIIFGGTFDNPAPLGSYSPNTGYGSLYAKIENLFDTQPVLIAFDYQPAAAGELHTAAAGVVDHLMEQGTYLTFLSTEPTGPALAEYFLATTQASHNYLHTQQYINLGYLPGESAGLLSFIIAPKQIIPLAFDGSNAWDSPPLQGVDTIQDFAMILVITDDPNTAKIWIEQVGTILEETPLTMVVSAQVEPLIQPYFRTSPQLLSGYVSGVIDSINYEGLIGRPNLANQRWIPFNIGIIITVGTIFIGGLANGVLSLFSRHRARRIGEIK
jgi:hypothetical protein